MTAKARPIIPPHNPVQEVSSSFTQRTLVWAHVGGYHGYRGYRVPLPKAVASCEIKAHL